MSSPNDDHASNDGDIQLKDNSPKRNNTSDGDDMPIPKKRGRPRKRKNTTTPYSDKTPYQ